MLLELADNLPLRVVMSIRRHKMVNTRIFVGKDESIRFTHSLKNFCWTVEGHAPIVAKTEGKGIMVSLLIGREFGFTFNLTKEEIDKVLVAANNKRNKTHYLNTKAAMELCVTEEK